MSKENEVKPIYRDDTQSANWYQCPICKGWCYDGYHGDEIIPLYCVQCGQALDWSEYPYIWEELIDQKARWKKLQEVR